MILLNEVSDITKKMSADCTDAYKLALSEAMETLVLLLQPAAPHTADELWEELGQKGFSLLAPWPMVDETLAAQDTITVAVQVNGKLRDTFDAPASSSDAELENAALALAKVQPYLDGKTIKKVIVIKGKLVNVVVA